MPAMIQVEALGESEYRVQVFETGSKSSYRVTLRPADYSRLAGGKTTTPEEFVRQSFEFLLEREAKESILGRFDLPVIGRYFPEYEREIKRRLG